MTRILVAWEDSYFDGLSRLVRRRLLALAPDPTADPPRVEFHTARGNSKFSRYVESTWTSARRVGLPGAPGVFDHLVCVVDADKLRDLMPTLPEQPREAAKVGAWHAKLHAAWEQKLHGWVDGSVPTTTVHGLVLRWSRESALLAGYDCAPFEEHLGFNVDGDAVRAFLRSECDPSPLALPDAGAFTDTFTKPYACLSRAFAKQGISLPQKNDARFEDVMRSLAKDHAETVCARVPDLDALTRLLWRLATPTLDVAPGAAPATPVRRKGGRARRT